MSIPGIGRKQAFRGLLRNALGFALALGVALVQPASAASGGAELGRDSVLAGLLRDALANRPELAQAQATTQADQARVPQARALPDPVLSLGVQNDGFKGLQIGTMETSYWSVVAAQTFPWYGKRGLRARAQSLGAKQSGTDLDRARLSVQSEVERGYLDLLLVRDQLRILGTLETLWIQAEGLSRSRYESSREPSPTSYGRNSKEPAPAAALGACGGRPAASPVLNRSVGRAFDRPIPTAVSLGDIADPPLPDSSTAEADAEARSPELQRARLAAEQSGALVSLAKKDYFPDLTVSGGLMPRGGAFEPMWQAGVSVPLPLWAGSKQSQAVREYRLRGQAAESSAETIRRLVRQRLEERRAMLTALLQTNRLYRSGVLIQSDATVSSAMAQYKVGKVPFAAVLEALSGYLTDLVGFYESVVAAQRIDIAQHEVSLDPVSGPALGGVGGASMSGSSGMGTASARTGSAPPAAAAGSTSSAMPKM
ncbi:MAG: TolC family protein [Betaproteobacteria bacterium]|nr:TolC family protein [Betaproteobacteria bacterium]